MHDSAFVFSLRGVPGIEKDAQHGAVLGEHLGDETLDAPLARGSGEMLKHDRAQSAALVGVLYDERDLGFVLVDPLVHRHADHVVAEQGDEGDPVPVVDVGEALDVAVGQRAVAGKETEVDRAVAEPGMHRDESSSVVGGDRAQVHGAAVAGDDVCLPVGGIRLLVGGFVGGAASSAASAASAASKRPSCSAVTSRYRS